MTGSLNFAIHLSDLAIWIDHIRDSLRRIGLERITCAIHQTNLAGSITKKRKGEMKLPSKISVLTYRIKTNSQNLNILFLIVGNSVAEPAPLCCSTRSICLRIKPQHNGFSPVIGKSNIFSAIVQNLEFRSCIPDF